MRFKSDHPIARRALAQEAERNAKHNAQDSGSFAKLERTIGGEPLEAAQDKEAHSGRVHIRFVSVRKRLCDPDNLSEKYLLDCLRYAGAILGDEPDKITLETIQRKANKFEKEHTLIEIMENSGNVEGREI